MMKESIMLDHTLTVWNAVDVPESVTMQVMALIDSYSPDIYHRDCDETGRCSA
jgi:hypothetical protein